MLKRLKSYIENRQQFVRISSFSHYLWRPTGVSVRTQALHFNDISRASEIFKFVLFPDDTKGFLFPHTAVVFSIIIVISILFVMIITVFTSFSISPTIAYGRGWG